MKEKNPGLINSSNSVAPTTKRAAYLSVLNNLTPVERHGDFLFKRDDLFRPFGPAPLNGGKLRQIMTILLRSHSLGVITGASIHSPQIPLVAGAAHHIGLRCVAVAGGKALTRELELAKQLGADIRRAASGRNRALFAEVSRINRRLSYHVIPYGIAPASCPHEFFATQSRQVENLPEELDTLVVTCGSGISTVGILLGIWRFSKVVRKLILVMTAPPRLEKILILLQSISPEARDYLKSVQLVCVDMFNAPGFKYEQPIRFNFCGVDLHPRYEAKAFRYVMERTNYSRPRTLFWVIGADLNDSGEGGVA